MVGRQSVCVGLLAFAVAVSGSGCGGETTGTHAATSAGGARAVGGMPTGGALGTGGAQSVGGAVEAGGGVEAGGTGTTGGSNGVGGMLDASGCPGRGGPSMVMLPEGYCIDSTEVTRGQFEAWLATNPSLPDASDADCGWKTSYAGNPTCLGSSLVCQGSGCDGHPQVCVDWCDASAYCKSVGKRLCGMIGGGSNQVNDRNDASLSQWYNACSSHGIDSYPYGNTHDPTACNDAASVSVPVASLPTCQSPAPGYQAVFDLVGNAGEWEDSCFAPGEMGGCILRGGAFDSAEPCGMFAFVGGYRHSTGPDVGFRCCS
jgi:sulfatase modifying factor 1